MEWSFGKLTKDNQQSYSWSRRRLDYVIRDGKTIYFYYDGNKKLKSRKIGNLEEVFKTKTAAVNYPIMTFKGWKPEREVSIEVNGKVIEKYSFGNRGELKTFFIGSKKYVVDTLSDGSVNMIFERIPAPGGGMGPPSSHFKQAYFYDNFGKLIIVLDHTNGINIEKPLSRYLYKSLYRDPVTEIYYLHNHLWYHPTLKEIINYKNLLTPPTIRVDPLKQFGYISQPPLTIDWHAVTRRMYKNAPEYVTSRIYGTMRVITGVIVIVVSLPADATGIGAVVGVPMAFWGADQIGTGLSEVITGKHHTSFGGRLIQTHVDDGVAGAVLTLVYDIGPSFYRGPSSIPRGLGIKAPPRLSPGDSLKIQEALRATRTPIPPRPVAPRPLIPTKPNPLPMGERIPVLPLHQRLPSGAMVGSGMKPRPGFKFTYEGRVAEMEGMVTVNSDDLVLNITGKSKKQASIIVRDAIHDLAGEAGLRRLEGPIYLRIGKKTTTLRPEGSRWHETPLWGRSNQIDVQSLPFRQHGIKGVRMSRHHRRKPGGRGFEGGTEQILVRILREAGIHVTR